MVDREKMEQIHMERILKEMDEYGLYNAIKEIDHNAVNIFMINWEGEYNHGMVYKLICFLVEYSDSLLVKVGEVLADNNSLEMKSKILDHKLKEAK